MIRKEAIETLIDKGLIGKLNEADERDVVRHLTACFCPLLIELRKQVVGHVRECECSACAAISMAQTVELGEP